MAKRLVTDMLRDAIRQSPVTRAQITRDTGISESQLSRYRSKTIGLSQDSIDILVDYLGLELRPKQPKGSKIQSRFR